MKYDVEILIDVPRERVVQLAMDASLMPLWQKDCVRRTLVDGVAGQVGAQFEVVSRMGKREMTMISTTTASDLPNGFSETYRMDGVWNGIDHEFQVVGEAQTRWCMRNEFQSTGLMMKIMMTLAPGMFKKQSLKYLNSFKAWAESYQG